MTAMPPFDETERKLRILHVLRAPVGGLFRHVIDLTYEQIQRGHAVGLVTDSSSGGERAADLLGRLEPLLALGLRRLPMRRPAHFSDIANAVQIALHIRKLRPDIVHGHGSKGGAYARACGFIPGFKEAVRAYTPHGGSFSYRGPLVAEMGYMFAERLFARTTDIFLFESAFIGRRFRDRCGEPKALLRIIPNGITPAEYVPVTPNADAAELLYVGELRAAKGIDTLLDAFARVVAERALRHDSLPRLVLVGSGPDREKLQAYAETRGVADRVTFAGAMPARKAFRLGQVLVVPSRAESLPYIVLEAAAAHVPMIATDVGGISEIFGPFSDRLITCDDSEILARRITKTLSRSLPDLHEEAAQLAAHVATRFTVAGMADAVLSGYAAAIERKHGHGRLTGSAVALPS